MLASQGRTFSVTAPTGIAAINVSGNTIHSWSGVGLGKDVRPLARKRIFQLFVLSLTMRVEISRSVSFTTRLQEERISKRAGF